MEVVLNESFKAFLRESFPQNCEAVVKIFEEVVNDRITTQKIGLEDLKTKAIHEVRAEFVTKDFLRAEIAEVRGEIQKTKIEILKWVFGMQAATITIILSGIKFLI